MRRAVHQGAPPAAGRQWVTALLRGVAAAALCWSSAASAFGPSGHRVAGRVAEGYLCAETRTALVPLLAGMTLADAGLWPDVIRSQPEWEHTKPWHFINVPDGGSVGRAASRDADQILAALARFEHELGDPTLANSRRGRALRFVAHFVVDIHQPLHVGRAADRGGNLIPVSVADRETNLHALWDGELLLQTLAPAPGGRARALLTPAPVAATIRRWQAASPVDWARESLRLRRQVYAFPATLPPVVLPAAYLEAARGTVDQRLLQAGVRLAGRLNALLGPGKSCREEVASRLPNL